MGLSISIKWEFTMNSYTITIGELRDKYKNNQINLEPPYQRKPSWKTKQRLLLLSSLFNGIPIPALILHKRFNNRSKKDIYDVLDGKQRVETILHFIELIEIEEEDYLYVEFIDPYSNKKDHLYYEDLKHKKVNDTYTNILEKFWRYEIPIIEYEGELRDFFERSVASKEIFVRINSTGSPLRKHEIRHARFNGPFFQLGNELERKYSKLFFEKWRIITKSDIERYLFHEFILELCTAIHFGGYSDRRKKLDILLSNYTWSIREIKQIKSRFIKIIEWIKEIFPDNSIKTTRFKNKSDFYSLFVVLLYLLNKQYVSNDKTKQSNCRYIFKEFSKSIQKLDPKVKAFKIPKLTRSEQKLFQYVISTRQSTDSIRNREIRHNYLIGVLKDGFILKERIIKEFLI